MQKIQHTETSQPGIALQDISELYATCHVLTEPNGALAQEVQGALGDAIEAGQDFAEVQLFGDDAALTLYGLTGLAHNRISRRQAAKNPAALYWRDMARQMLAEYQSPDERQNVQARVAAYEQQLVDQGAAPYQERLIARQAEQRAAGRRNVSFTRIFRRLAQLELGDGSDLTEVSCDDIEPYRKPRHSDRVLFVVK